MAASIVGLEKSGNKAISTATQNNGIHYHTGEFLHKLERQSANIVNTTVNTIILPIFASHVQHTTVSYFSSIF